MSTDELELQEALLKIKWLKTHRKLCYQKMSENEPKFRNEVDKILIENDLKRDVDNIPKKKEEDVESESVKMDEKKAKTAFREISKKTHPDKNPDAGDLFQKASDAYNTGDWEEFIKVATEVGVDVEPDIDSLKKNIKSIEDEINKLRSTFLWLWLDTKDDIIKKELVGMFIAQNYKHT